MNFLIFSIVLSFSVNIYAQIGPRGSIDSGKISGARYYDKIKTNSDGSVTITNPKLKTSHGNLPLIAYSKEICNAFGYIGGNPSKVKFSKTAGKDALKLSTSLSSNVSFSRLNPDKDISVYYQVTKTEGRLNRYHFQIATEVTCSNLNEVLEGISSL